MQHLFTISLLFWIASHPQDSLDYFAVQSQESCYMTVPQILWSKWYMAINRGSLKLIAVRIAQLFPLNRLSEQSVKKWQNIVDVPNQKSPL